MPLFCDAYLGDTMHLSLEEHGAYLKILMVTWTHNGVPLPDDDRRMARVLGIPTARWKQRIKPALTPFFDLSEGVFRQKRLEKEWNFILGLRRKQSEKGLRSAEVKRLIRQQTGSTVVELRLQPEANRASTPIPIPIPIRESPYGDMSAERRRDCDEMVKIWHQAGLPAIRKLTTQRRAKLLARLHELGSLNEWSAIIDKITASKFLRGEPGPWRADLDWAIEPRNIIRIQEGKYDDRPSNGFAHDVSERRTPREPPPPC
jgi:uncharacterized protein YdaU (DUF1376 family)